ncbi:syndecan-2-like [Archocentrus centrarchus]|uniref:syndecan-2-like n=1 Tax=Archocentrus centrarchus TaxID=63155 RepID=UPI0011E9C817|nr:syndecan-2-like [Archocentrus centrarchus]XP_030606194.1 syndecan-2-like [Archocentrus centrarchus]XP_030606195.1 syndecan-2-like [Archocentrus centrarchus]
MGNLWWLLLVGLAAGSISERIFVSSQSFSTDDLYIEGQTSGDLPIDDEDGEDGGSGSGSGDFALLSREVFQSQPTASTPHNPPTTAARSQQPATTVKDTQTPWFIIPDGDNKDEEVPDVGPSTTNTPLSDTTAADDGAMDSNDRNLDGLTPIYEDTIKKSVHDGQARAGHGDRLQDVISSENLLERKEVLAAVIACGVVGFLCAVFLLALLAYRMKKKDEGSYELGDNKLSVTAYHKAPTKEFYA